MSFFDPFVATFGNILTDVFFLVFILIGILLGIFLRPMVGNRILKLDPSTHRFHELDIREESAISIECQDKKGMPPQKFFKHHPGFTGIVGRFMKKNVTLFLGRTGTAYTWRLESGSWKKLGGLAEAIQTVWGAAFYDSVPDKQKMQLEESEIQVTVGLSEDPLTPEGYKEISEEDIHKEEDRAAARTFWKERDAKNKSLYINIILAAGLGFGICAALFLLGIFKTPVVYVPISPTPFPTATLIPTPVPTLSPTIIPTLSPTAIPTLSPTANPTITEAVYKAASWILQLFS
jgi:hypothetical protein